MWWRKIRTVSEKGNSSKQPHFTYRNGLDGARLRGDRLRGDNVRGVDVLEAGNGAQLLLGDAAVVVVASAAVGKLRRRRWRVGGRATSTGLALC